MTIEERLVILEQANAALAKRVGHLEQQQSETRSIFETLSQTVSCTVGDMQEAHNNTLTHFMGSLDVKVKKLIKEGLEISKSEVPA
jgi:hypothetical protein